MEKNWPNAAIAVDYLKLELGVFRICPVLRVCTEVNDGSPRTRNRAAQNTVAGRVIPNESSVGVPNLLVVMFSPQPVILVSSAPRTAVSGDRVWSGNSREVNARPGWY